MENRTGIVMKIEKNLAYIMTTTGEFAKIKINKNSPFPSIGSEYCGPAVKNTYIKTNVLRYAAAACLAFTILLSGGGAYSYYKPVSTVTVSINPEIELKSNIWNRVISVTPLNSDGKKITNEISLKNKEIDTALVSILNQAKDDDFINDTYKELNKVITVNISGKELNLSSFEKEIKKNDLSVKVDRNGSTILNNLSNKNNDTLYKDSSNNKSSESTNQTNNKNNINNSITNKSTKPKNAEKENSNIKNNNTDFPLNNSDKSKDENYNKNSSKNSSSNKQNTNSEKLKNNSKDKLDDSDNQYHNSNKNNKQGKDK